MKRFIIFFISLVLFVGCEKGPTTTTSTQKTEVEPEETKRAILLYMMANNNLDSYISINIDELVAAYDEQLYEDNAIFVYYKGASKDSLVESTAVLLKITNSIAPDTVINYSAHNGASPEVLRDVISDFKHYALNAEEYGVVFSSHGGGWLPKSFMNSSKASALQFLSYPLQTEGPVTKFFGQDGDNWFDIDEMATALDSGDFDFIIFDACYMGCIEVLHLFRDKAKFMMMSAAEILGSGYDYENFASRIFGDGELNERMTSLAVDYAIKQEDYTVGVYDMTKYDTFIEKYGALQSTIEDKKGNCSISSFSNNKVQQFGRSTYANLFFDLVNYIEILCGETTACEVESWSNELVIFKAHSPSFLSGWGGFDIDHFCGVTTFIPAISSSYIDEAYKQLDWYKEIEYVKPDTISYQE